MAEHMPTTDEVRERFIDGAINRATATGFSVTLYIIDKAREDFDRWLAEVRREAAALTPPSLPSVEALADALAAEGIDPEPGELDLTPLAERLLALSATSSHASALTSASARPGSNPYRKKEATDE